MHWLVIRWIDLNIYDHHLAPDEKVAFLNKAVDWLTAHGFTLDDLVRDKFRLRNALEAKIADAKRLAMEQVHERLLLAPEEFTVNDRSEVVFQRGRYAYDSIYCGFTELPKHFFPQIGNLKGEGEEFECALFLATQLEGVKFWVRNVERKASSFSLHIFIPKLRSLGPNRWRSSSKALLSPF